MYWNSKRETHLRDSNISGKWDSNINASFFFQGRHLYTYCRWMVHVVLILFYIFIIILNSDFSRMSEKNQSTESIKLMPRFARYKLNITVYNNICLIISRHLILCYIIIVFSKIYDPFLIYYSFWWGRHIMCYQIKLWYLSNVSLQRSVDKIWWLIKNYIVNTINFIKVYMK